MSIGRLAIVFQIGLALATDSPCKFMPLGLALPCHILREVHTLILTS